MLTFLKVDFIFGDFDLTVKKENFIKFIHKSKVHNTKDLEVLQSEVDSKMSTGLSHDGVSLGHVRAVSKMYENRSLLMVEASSMQQHRPSLKGNGHGQRKASNLLTRVFENPLLQAFLAKDSSFAKNSENLSPDQVRNIFSALLSKQADNVQPQHMSGENKRGPSTILKFSFLKELFMHTFNTSLYLAQLPTLKITDAPKIKPSFGEKYFGNRKSNVKVGKALADLKLNTQSVPVIVEKCTEFIMRHGLHSEGIYRVNGNAYNVDKLIRRFKKSSEKLIKFPKYDEFDVASAFKKFIRDLPEPLIGELSNKFLETSQLNEVTEKLEAYKTLLETLPFAEWQTLRKILDHLREIDKYSDENKMPGCNLAIIWAQNLMCADVHNYDLCKDVIVDLMQHFDAVFTVPERSDEIAEPKKSDLKVWIKHISMQEVDAVADKGHFMRISLAPKKTVNNVCKEQAEDARVPIADITMIEVLSNGALKRPMHPNEIIADSVLRWDNFTPADRQNNHFVVVPTKFFYHTEVLSKMHKSFFVDYMNSIEVTKLTAYIIFIEDRTIKLVDKNQPNQSKTVDMGLVHAYLGVDPKKYDAGVKNAITLYECDKTNSKSNGPVKSHLLTSQNDDTQMILYLSITHNSHAGITHEGQKSIQ